MGSPAHRTLVQFGAEPVETVDEACSLVTGTTYQITAQTHRVLDPLEPIVVKDGGTVVNAADYLVDPLFGTVTFTSAPSGAVTVSAHYIPLVKIGCPRSVSVSLSRETLDVTCMDPDTEARQRRLGLKDLTISADLLEEMPLIQEYTFGAVEKSIKDILESDDIPIIVSVRFGNVGDTIRSFVKLASHDASAELEGLVESSIEFESTSRGDVAFGKGPA